MASVLSAAPAQANSPRNAFTSANLSTWQTDGVVWALASAGGLVFAGGDFTALRAPGTAVGDASSVSRADLAVLNGSTGVPTSCTLDVTRSGGSSIVRSLAVSPDGSTLYVGGLFTSVQGVARSNIAAVDIASCTVTSFNPSVSSFVYSLAVTETTVYIGGNFATVSGATRNDLAAVKAGTGQLLSWAPVADDDILALAVDPHTGNVIIGGRLNYINSVFSHALAVVDGTKGTINVKTYPMGFFPYTPGTGQRAGTSVIKTIGLDGDGFYTGSEGTGPGIFDGRTAFNWTSYDQRWRDLCLGATQAVLPLNGILFWASHSHNCSLNSPAQWEDGARHYFGSETTNDMTFQSWLPQANNGIGEQIGPRALTLATTSGGSQYLWSGGEFTQVNGANQQGLTRFGQGTDTIGPANMYPPEAFTTTPNQVKVVWRSTIDTDDFTLTYRVYRNGSSQPIATVVADSPPWSRPQVSWTDTNVTAGTTYSYRITASDGTNTTPLSTAVSATPVAASSSAYPARIQADGAGSYFRSDDPNLGSTSVYAGNQGGNSVGAVYYGNVTRTVGGGPITGDTSGSYMTFDGSSAFVHTETREQAPSVYSLETWFKTTTANGGRLIGFGTSAFNNGVNLLSTQAFDRHIYMTNTGGLIFGENAGSAQVTLSSANGYNDGKWHQVVAVQGSTGMSLYIDGVVVARNTNTTTNAYSGYWRLGGDSLSGWPHQSPSYFFAGSMDETAIYPLALTGQQVADHFRLSGQTNAALPAVPTDSYGQAVYNDHPDSYWRLGETTGTVAADSSANGRPGTYGSAVTKGVAGALTGVSNTAVSVANSASATVFSAASTTEPAAFSGELWFKTSATTGGKLLGFGTSATGNSTSYDRSIYLTNSGQLVYGVNPSGTPQVITTSASYNNNAWHHVVGTQDSTGLKLWVDGTLVGTNTAATGNAGLTGYVRLGGDTIASPWPSVPTNKYVTGSLDEATVYSYALSQAQIQNHYALGAGKTPPDTQAPTTPGSPTATASGTTVTVGWTASTDNVGVTGYRVYRSATTGFTAGSTTAIADVAASALSYTDSSRPAGTWYYRVAAFDAIGNVSVASAQVGASVADTTAPSAASSLYATVQNRNVWLTWTAATDNVGVVDYRVYRSTTSSFVPSAATKIADVAYGTSYVDSGLAQGAYYYLVVAVDAAGNAGPVSNPAQAAVDVIPPSTPTNVTATAASTSVNLSWSASTDNVGVAGYRIWRSTTSGFTPDDTTKIADVTSGTSYADTNLTAATYYYVVAADDLAGNFSGPAPQVSATVATADTTPPSAPGNVSATVGSTGVSLTWTASTDDVAVAGYRVYRSTTSGAGIVPANKIADVAAGATGYVDATSGVGTFYYIVTAIDAVPNESAASNQVSATVPDIQAPTAPTGLTATVTNSDVALSWTASTDNVGVTGYNVYRSSTSGFAPAAGNLVGTATATGFTDPARPSGTWYYVVTAVDAAGNESAASTQASAGIGDVTPPTAPAQLVATVTGSSVALTWSAATDNVGVTGYKVYRSATSGFTPSAAALVTTVGTPGYTDASRPAGNWYYLVTAVDAAGNESAASNQATGTVTGVVSTVALNATEDTYGSQSAPTTNYGTAINLSVRGGGTAGSTAFLKFTLPAAPAGTTLTGATLTFRTTSDSTAGSADPIIVSLAPTTWTETTLTWNNMPAPGTSIGTLTGVTGVNKPYTYPLRAATLGTLAAGPISLAISDNGSDNLLLSSRQGAAANQPVLTLTYSIPADTQAPTAPTGLTATASGSSVGLSWTAATDDVGVTDYLVYRSATAGFSPSPATQIADVSSGTTWTDAARPSGTWYYLVVAVDAAGNRSPASTQASAGVGDTTPPTAPSGLGATVSGSSVTLSWTAATDDVGVTDYLVYRSATAGFTPGAATQIADVTSGTGYTDGSRPAGTWYYLVVAADAAGNTSAASNQASAAVPDTTPPTAPTGLTAAATASAIGLSWTASTDDVGVTGYQVYRSATSGFTPGAGSLLATVTSGTSYSDTNPGSGTWYYVVTASDAAGNTSAASAQVSASLSDTVAPTAPASLTATGSGTTVSLGWTAATDNVGVTGYRVYRSASTGVTATAANLVATVTAGTSYADNGRSAGNWFYVVTAIDAAGNESAASNEASGTVAGTLTTVSLTPTEDTYVNQAAPSTNYGTTSSLASRGASGTTAYIAFLKFTLPAAPAGMVLSGAKLSFRTTTDSFAGSNDTHLISLAPSTWSETTLIWTNKPTVGAQVGTITAGTAVNTAYTFPLTTASIAAQPTGALSLAVSSAGSDNIWFLSRETPTIANRPSLILTYQSAN